MFIRAAAGLALALSATAGQAETPVAPDWAMLTECSAVFDAVSRADGYAGAGPEQTEQAAEVSTAFLARAVSLAAESGQADPQGDVDSVMGYLTERWDNRIGDILATASNLDWIGYCGQIGRKYAVLPLPR
jgi:hypothetical protein